MAVLYTQKRFKSCIYNITVDGGLVGAINLGLVIPAFSSITKFYVKSIATFQSGGLAEVSFYLSTGLPLLVQQTFTNFDATTNTVMQGIDFSTPGDVNNNPASSVTMEIFTAALTAGKLIAFVEYTESPY